MIEKIKVTKQEIRTYETNGRIMSYTYSTDFINTLLQGGKYVISDKNSNVTWYTKEAIIKAPEPVATEQIETDIIEALEAEGYTITQSAKTSILENDINIDELRAAAKDKKITGHTINSIL
jgi:hypothetical protein